MPNLSKDADQIEKVGRLVRGYTMRDFFGPSALDLLARGALIDLSRPGGQAQLRAASPVLAERATKLQRSYTEAEYSGHEGGDLVLWKLLRDIVRAVGG